MNMKKMLKNTLPDGILDKIRVARNNMMLSKLYQNMMLSKLYRFDKKRFKMNSYLLRNNFTINNLRSKITFHYHSIEKGLSNANLRLGFGKNAFSQLFYSMDKYIELGYPTEDNRFQEAISVIEEYVNLHEENNYPVEWVESKLNEYFHLKLEGFTGTGGYGMLHKKDLPDFSNSNFEELALNRWSIRDFGTEAVEDEKINNAIRIATKTPSACNRQSSKVYRIKNKEILQKVFEMQGGLTTNGENLQEMLLVTSNREYMNGAHERNQTYIDGGMFLMSLVYSLTYQQVATCVLNTNFDLKREKAMRELLSIPYSEDLIAFIAIGSYAEENKYALSPRDKSKEITVLID